MQAPGIVFSKRRKVAAADSMEGEGAEEAFEEEVKPILASRSAVKGVKEYLVQWESGPLWGLVDKLQGANWDAQIATFDAAEKKRRLDRKVGPSSQPFCRPPSQ